MIKIILFLSLFILPMMAKNITLTTTPSQSVISDHGKTIVYLKVDILGHKLTEKTKRTPLNVALVLDRSGSMSGDKIEKTKQAAKAFVQRLDSNDIVSIVLYDSTVDILLPAGKINDREKVISLIDTISTRGNTALYAGVQAGAQELEKFLNKERVNRIILLSDGLANVGPSSSEALGELGKSLVQKQISVTTLGLGQGYNEDLMSKLAYMSDGNHKFLQTNDEIEHFFNKELGFISSVAAQNVQVTIECVKGIKPLRMLDVSADIEENTVKSSFNQIYGDHSRYMILEVEADGEVFKQSKPLGTVTLNYFDMREQKNVKFSTQPMLKRSSNVKNVSDSFNNNVMISVIEQKATQRNAEALKLRDADKIEEAKAVLKENITLLKAENQRYGSEVLQTQIQNNEKDLQHLDDANWLEQRKVMKDNQTKSFFKGCL